MSLVRRSNNNQEPDEFPILLKKSPEPNEVPIYLLPGITRDLSNIPNIMNNPEILSILIQIIEKQGINSDVGKAATREIAEQLYVGLGEKGIDYPTFTSFIRLGLSKVLSQNPNRLFHYNNAEGEGVNVGKELERIPSPR